MKAAVPAWIGLGSNVGDCVGNLRQALDGIASIPGISITARSSIYRSEAWGNTDQADFHNAVVRVEVGIAPGELLCALQEIENGMGRQRGPERWGPRNIDLDLLLFDTLEHTEEGLQLPHPRMHLRRFVLAPLEEVSPGLVIPGHGAVSKCLENTRSQALARLGKFP